MSIAVEPVLVILKTGATVNTLFVLTLDMVPIGLVNDGLPTELARVVLLGSPPSYPQVLLGGVFGSSDFTGGCACSIPGVLTPPVDSQATLPFTMVSKPSCSQPRSLLAPSGRLFIGFNNLLATAICCSGVAKSGLIANFLPPPLSQLYWFITKPPIKFP